MSYLYSVAPRTIAFDIETTGLNPYKGARAFTFATCSQDGVTHVDDNPRNIQQMLYNTDHIICHNYHFEYSVLKAQGFIIPDRVQWHDTMIIHQLLFNLAYSHGLDEVALDLCSDRKLRNYWIRIDEQINKAKKIYGTFDKFPKELIHPYQRNDVERTMLIFQTLYPYIQQDSRLLRCYQDEIDLIKVTTEFESYGMMLDRKECMKLIRWIEGELTNAGQESYSLLKRHINLNSTKQVADLLFNQIGLPPVKVTEKKNNSLEFEVIDEMMSTYRDNEKVYKALDLVLRTRSYIHGLAMIQSYLNLADENDILRPHINTNQAASGRESSSKPNLQNVSKEVSLLTRYPIPARSCFRARPGCLLYPFDEKGIELRLIVEHTQEPELVELIRINGDPHDLAAACFYGDRYTQENDKNKKRALRSAAKNMHFALCYRINKPGKPIDLIANGLGLTVEEAKPGFDRYCERFPKMANFAIDSMDEARTTGCVYTSFGRKLHIPKDNPKAAANYKIQGTAAGIIKRAQIQAARVLRSKYPDVHILLPIHDEIIFEAPRRILKYEQEFINDISDAMTTVPEIGVPLAVEVKRSTLLWSQAKEILYAKAV
jgi:DNA polymerase I